MQIVLESFGEFLTVETEEHEEVTGLAGHQRVLLILGCWDIMGGGKHADFVDPVLFEKTYLVASPSTPTVTTSQPPSRRLSDPSTSITRRPLPDGSRVRERCGCADLRP